MANRRLIAAVRELAEAGWKRDLTFGRKSMLIVWKDPDERIFIALEPGVSGYRWATLRIGTHLDRGGSALRVRPGLDTVVLVDAKVSSWQCALRILHAYGVITDEVTP